MDRYGGPPPPGGPGGHPPYDAYSGPPPAGGPYPPYRADPYGPPTDRGPPGPYAPDYRADPYASGPVPPGPPGPSSYAGYSGPPPPLGPGGAMSPRREPPRGFAPPGPGGGPPPAPYYGAPYESGPPYAAGPPPPLGGGYGHDRGSFDYDRRPPPGGPDYGPPGGGPGGYPPYGSPGRPRSPVDRYGGRERDYGGPRFGGPPPGGPDDRYGPAPDRYDDRGPPGGRRGGRFGGGRFDDYDRDGPDHFRGRGGRGGGFRGRGGRGGGGDRDYGRGDPPVQELSRTEHDQLARERLNRERPCRTLFVRNINFDATPEQIRDLFDQHGEIKTFFDLSQKRGLVFITYYDIRAAEQAKTMLHGVPLAGRPLDIHYSLPRESEQAQQCDADKNQGTILLILRHSKQPLEDEALASFLSRWGEIKSIRPFNNDPFARYVEFFDSRSMLAAHDQLIDTDYQGGRWDIKYAWDFVDPAAVRAARSERERSPPPRPGFIPGGGRRYEDRPPLAGRDEYPRGPGYGAVPSGASPVPAASTAGTFAPPPADDAAAAERLAQAQKVQAILAALGKGGAPAADTQPATTSSATATTTATSAPGPAPASTSAPLPASVLALLGAPTPNKPTENGTSVPATSAPAAPAPPANILALLGQNGAAK